MYLENRILYLIGRIKQFNFCSLTTNVLSCHGLYIMIILCLINAMYNLQIRNALYLCVIVEYLLELLLGYN